MSTGFHKKDLPPDELREIVRAAMPRHDLEAIDFMVKSLIRGESYDKMELKLNINGKIPPVCRNCFYRLRRQIIGQINGGGGGSGEE